MKPVHIDADQRRAALALEHRPHQPAEHGAVEDREEHAAGQQYHAENGDVVGGEHDVADDDRIEAEHIRHRQHGAPPLMPHQAAQQVADADRHDRQRQMRRMAQAAHQQALDRSAEQEHQQQHGDGGHDEGQLQQQHADIGAERGQHDHVALAEIHHRRRAVQHRHRQRDQGVHRALRHAADDQLVEHGPALSAACPSAFSAAYPSW